MRIAFYAPMKPPDHPVPSGDRRMAQLILRALRAAGHRASIASRLRSYDGNGCAGTQRRIATTAKRIASRYVARYRGRAPDLWFTFHCYHKAPDLLGPAVADAFGIPYVIADASVAPKQEGGAWADGYAAANAAIRRADRLIAFDPADVPALRRLRDSRDIVSIPPLAEPAATETKDRNGARAALAVELDLDPAMPWFASVAMMRPGAKLQSYEVLSGALGRIADRPWALLIAGDGPARSDVEALFIGFDTVRFLGQVDATAIDRLYRACDLALWPAVDEGYCMALVEAQIVGLPVVAGNRPGIANVVADGRTGLLTRVGDDTAFARAILTLLDDPDRRDAMADAARRHARRFALTGAADTLDAVLHAACGSRAAA